MVKLLTPDPFVFDEDKHQYTLEDGTILPSVTEIIRFLNVDKISGAREWLRDEAARIGTLVHSLTALIDYGEDIEVPWKVQGYISAYRSFLRDYNPQWDYVELPLASKSCGFAGTIDRIGRIDGMPCIVDYKTTGSTPGKAILSAQLTGYEILAKAAGMKESAKLLGLHLRRDGTYKLIESEKNLDLFLCCVTLLDALKKNPRIKRKGEMENGK